MTTLYLIVKVATAQVSAQADSFIEAAERWTQTARALLKARQLSLIDVATWQRRTELDLARCLGHGSDFRRFQSEGSLLPTEYEQGEAALRSALNRQIRFLKELIHRADQEQLDFDLAEFERLHSRIQE